MICLIKVVSIRSISYVWSLGSFILAAYTRPNTEANTLLWWWFVCPNYEILPLFGEVSRSWRRSGQVLYDHASGGFYDLNNPSSTGADLIWSAWISWTRSFPGYSSRLRSTYPLEAHFLAATNNERPLMFWSLNMRSRHSPASSALASCTPEFSTWSKVFSVKILVLTYLHTINRLD